MIGDEKDQIIEEVRETLTLKTFQERVWRLEAENKTLQDRRKAHEESIESKERQEAEMREELQRLLRQQMAERIPGPDTRQSQKSSASVAVPPWPLPGSSTVCPVESSPSQKNREQQLEEEMSEIRKAFEAVEMQQRRKDAEAQRLEAELRQSLEEVLREAEKKAAEAERLREELRGVTPEGQTLLVSRPRLPSATDDQHCDSVLISSLEAENRDLRETNRRLEEELQVARRESAAISTTLLGEITALNGAQHRMATEVERLQRCFPEQQAELEHGAARMRELVVENEELRWHLAECQQAMPRSNSWDVTGAPLVCAGLPPLIEEDLEG